MAIDKATLEKLIEMGAYLSGLTTKVSEIDRKLDELRTDHATTTATELAITKTKVDRLERIVYGFGSLAVVEGIALLAQALSK